MQTQCKPQQFEFEAVGRRSVMAAFDGGAVSSDAGALLLAKAAQATGLIGRFAECFEDRRDPDLIEHSVKMLVGQRVLGVALGYEDLIDHDELRHDPLLGAVLGKLESGRKQCAPLAGKSTLNRLERTAQLGRYHKISHHAAAIEDLFVELFLQAHPKAPERIVLDLDATDDPVHGEQEGRFFHGYYGHYCYLPLYIFCGKHLLVAKLRPSNIDASAGSLEEIERVVAQIRARWPAVQIVLRADSGFARDPLMSWCETHAVDYVLGLARNSRLEAEIEPELQAAKALCAAQGKPARLFKDFTYRGAAVGSLRRSHLHRHDEGQPATAVVRLDGLRAGEPATRAGARRHCACQCHRRNHQAEALQDRRPGEAQRAPRQDRRLPAAPAKTCSHTPTTHCREWPQPRSRTPRLPLLNCRSSAGQRSPR